MEKIKWVSGKGKNVRSQGSKGTVKKVFISLMVTLLIVAGLALALGFYVRGIDTVYPNVSIDGIDISGLALDEACRVLLGGGYENNAEGISATVKFPDGGKIVITAREAGFSLSAEEAASVAIEYGRAGSMFDNGVTYIKSLFNETELSVGSVVRMNEEFVRGTVAERTKSFNDALREEAYTIGSDSIVVLKGAGSESAVEDDVYDLTVSTLYRALDERDNLTVEYTPGGTDNEFDLEALYEKISVEPVDAAYDTETWEVTQSVTGVSFDMAAARALLDNARAGVHVVIPLLFTEPVFTTEGLESALFRDELATRKTYIAGSSNRLSNIKLVAESINGTVLNPGGEFSFNGIVGKRTSERGFREAGAYMGGNVVQEIGGGICQVSSTIYDCVLHADLEVVERRAHSFTVSYLPFGNDATINWGTIDFRFKNNTDYPLKIETEVSGRDLTVRLIGTKTHDNYIKTEYTVISTTPFQTIQKEDESVPPGESIAQTDGFTGYVVDTYKNYYDKDGNHLEKVYVGRSTYRVQNRIILIPIPESEPEDPGATETPPDVTETPPDVTETPPDAEETPTDEVPPQIPDPEP